MHAFFRNFGYAFKGIYVTIINERNMRVHLCVAFYVYLFSLFYHFSRVEYAVLTVIVFGVLALELVNTSLERSVENPAPNRYQTAGVVKDIAAGAVLVFGIGAAVGGVFLFWDTAVFLRIFAYFKTHIPMLVLLALSLAGSWWFIFRIRDLKPFLKSIR